MSKNEKSIDGLTVRRPSNANRQLGAIPKKTTTKKPVTRKTTSKKPQTTIGISPKKASSDDFLKPVGSFDFDLTSDDIKEERKKQRKNKFSKNKKGQKKKHKALKRTIIIALSILIIAGIVFFIWGDLIIAKLTGGNSGLWDVLVSKDVPLKTDENGRSNVLIFGTSGYNMDGDEGDGTHDGAQLTDSIMVASLDQNTKDVAMVSLPRDLKVPMACSAGKINEVYWCNNMDGTNEQAGADALKAQVEKVLGMDIQYYVHVNWGSLVQVVDSIGGITVTLDEDINDDWTKTYIKAGTPTTLDGEQALGLARARHGTEGGDFSRGNSQQKILIALEKKILDNGIDLGEALNLVNTLGDNVRTNFNIDEIKTLINLFKEFDLNNMRQLSLVDHENNIYYVTNANIGGVSFVVPTLGEGNYSDIKKLIAQGFSSNPVTREGANILVLNGSGVAGTAAKEQTNLENEGYTVADIDDAPAGNYASSYYIYDITGEKSATKSALESKYNTTALPANELPAGIYTNNYDFVIIVGEAAVQKTENN